jgi:DnaJ-class molecular chaperone
VSHYAVLGVLQTATVAEIKRAWQAIAGECHPDRTNDGAKHEKFKAAARAYHCLSSPVSRAAYNVELNLKPKCARCGGVGTVQKQKGFTKRIAVPCPECANE